MCSYFVLFGAKLSSGGIESIGKIVLMSLHYTYKRRYTSCYFVIGMLEVLSAFIYSAVYHLPIKRICSVRGNFLC